MGIDRAIRYQSDLHILLRQMRIDFPSLGQTMVWGRLRSLGFRVTRARVREAIRVTDPIHTALRWRQVTPRRLYSVPGPNSLWHIGMLHRRYNAFELKILSWQIMVISSYIVGRLTGNARYINHAKFGLLNSEIFEVSGTQQLIANTPILISISIRA